MRKLVSILLCLVVVIGLIPLTAMPAQAAYPTPMSTNSYDSDWHYWSQAGTKYRFFYYPSGGSKGGMHYAGCHVVAEAKLLVDAGIASSNVGTFNPDIYLEWANGTYFNANSSTYPVGINVKENNNRGPVAYAQKLGKTLYYCGNVSGSSFPSDRTAQITLIRSWLDKGYYVILGRSDHEVYISKYDENGNVVSGDLIMYDSQSDMINSNHMFSGEQPYTSSTTIKTTGTKKYLIESYNAYSKNFTYAKLYSKTTSSLPSSSTATYTISYNANGGTGAPAAQTKTAGVALALTSTCPNRSGCNFLGWAESSSAASPTYHSGDSFTKDANTTLYAVWGKKLEITGGTGTYVLGDTVSLRFSAGGVSGYAVVITDSNGKTVLSAWTSETSYDFTPTAAGCYSLTVTVTIRNGAIETKQVEEGQFTVVEKPQGHSVSTNKSTYLLGETVLITPSAAGADYYAISIWDGGDYGVGTNVCYNGHFTGSISYQPEAAGTYGILCNAFNDAGYVSAKTTFDVVDVVLTGWMNSEGTIHLSWTNPGWNGYWDIFRNSEASFGEAQKIARLNGSADSWVDNTTQLGSRYFYMVRPVTGSGFGLAESNAIEFITPDPAPPAIDSVTVSKTAAGAGTPVTWTASASGGVGTLQYCFYVFKDGKIAERGNYGTTKSYTYTPTAGGVYTVRVYVKDANGTVVTLDNAAAVNVANAPLTVTGVTVSKTAAAVGTPVTWTASANGGVGTLQYCFYVFKNGKVAERGSYGAARTYTYAPSAGGVYTVRVYVKDANGTVVTLDNAAAVNVANAPLTVTGVTAGKTAATVGDSVTWTASANGGVGTLQYCFYVFKDGKVAERGSYGTAKTYTYTPAAAGTYTVRVYVKDACGTVVTLDNVGTVHVTAPAAPIAINNVKANKTTAGLGETITWTASATGGSGALQYCFYVFRNGTVVFRGTYGTAKSCSYKPAAAGTYTVRLYVKDGAGTVETLDNAGKVTVTASADPIAVTGVRVDKTLTTTGDSITWTASATGGVGTLQYCFYVFKDGKIAERGNYGTAKTYTYTPAAAGTYTVRVYVKDTAGAAATLDNAGKVTVN